MLFGKFQFFTVNDNSFMKHKDITLSAVIEDTFYKMLSSQCELLLDL